MEKTCLVCLKVFRTPRPAAKYCGQLCYSSAPKTPECKAKMSLAGKGRPKPAGFGQSVSRATKGKPKPWIAGENNPNYGNKAQGTPEATAVFRAAVKRRGQPWTEAHRMAHSATMKSAANAMLGTRHSDKTKAAVSAAKILQYQNGEVDIRRINVSKAESEILKIIQLAGIPVQKQFRIKGVRFIYDFYLPETNTILEYNGDYWHCNPIKYKSGTSIKFQRGGTKLVDEIWERDTNKKAAAVDAGYNFVTLWEFEYKKLGAAAVLNAILK